MGAFLRRDYVGPRIPDGRIFGVLNEPAFNKQFVDATRRPQLTIRWATAIAMTDLSLSAGFNKLKDAAFDWHRQYGLTMVEPSGESAVDTEGQFWESFANRPALFMGNDTGWTLYCFLNGMKKGGDWLGLHSMPQLDEIVTGIARRSERAYGSPFAAFRVYNAKGLLEWVGLPSPESAN